MRGVAEQNLQICSAGQYGTASGRIVDVAAAISRAKLGTRLYTPEEGAALPLGAGKPTIQVVNETTTVCARKHSPDVCVLSFASAKNPGGGFLGGAKAQEEDLCRASALYVCLVTQPKYYEANRAFPSNLYTDTAIFSPQVPFFRDDHGNLLEVPFHASVVTAPAPNAGEVLRKAPTAGPAIREALERRARIVLAIAAAHHHRVIVLGAWGCGVFRNDPREVADVFANLLVSAPFDRVLFAIPGTGKNFDAFAARFRGP